jgi:hypothetical protein
MQPLAAANPMLARVQNDSQSLRRNLSLPDLTELSFFDEVLTGLNNNTGGMVQQPSFTKQEPGTPPNPFMPGVAAYVRFLPIGHVPRTICCNAPPTCARAEAHGCHKLSPWASGRLPGNAAALLRRRCRPS